MHPYNTHGEKLTGVPDWGESLAVWSYLACVLCVDDMWPILTECLATNRDTQGYLLSLAWSYIKAGRGGERKSGDNFFRVKKPRKKKATASAAAATLREEANVGGPEPQPTLEIRFGLNGGKMFLWPPKHVTVQEGVFRSDVCETDLAVVYYNKTDDFCYTNEGET